MEKMETKSGAVFGDSPSAGHFLRLLRTKARRRTRSSSLIYLIFADVAGNPYGYNDDADKPLSSSLKEEMRRKKGSFLGYGT